MSERICCICKATVESENPAVLTVSSFGNPRYLCHRCDSDFETALSAKEYPDIKDAITRIGEKMETSSVEDELVVNEVGEILGRAAERAEAIFDGSYDFSLDDSPEPAEAEEEAAVAEEEKEEEETEEDKARRLKKEKVLKIVDTVTTWTVALAIVGAIGYFIYKLIF